MSIPKSEAPETPRNLLKAGLRCVILKYCVRSVFDAEAGY
jgi:hypothetical protein